MKLCTYLLTNDTGLAPNPYHGWCSLAVCTPNHQGARLDEGDWIAGFLNKSRQYRLVYLLKVEERICLDDYYRDSRFSSKRPDLRGDWKARCGDNFYSLNHDGEWQQHRNRFHIGPDFLVKDTRNPFAFIGREFWYFGRSAMKSPKRFDSLRGGRGIRVNHDPNVATEFISWVTSNWEPGIHDLPNDNPDIPD